MRYTDEELLEQLRDLALTLGKSPSAVDANANPNIANVSTYMTRFGSWSKAKELAGITTPNKFGAKTDEDLIKSLAAFYDKNGRHPKLRECRAENGLFGPNTYKDRFGGWDKALEAAGLYNDNLRTNQVSDSWLLASLSRFYAEEGLAPRHEDCNDSNRYLYLKSHMVYVRRFGGFSEALTLAGVPLNIPSASILENDFITEITKLTGITNIIRSYVLSDNTQIDAYFPDYGIGIEVNGLYWHSTSVGKSKDYHINKTIRAAEEHIKLIHVWEHELINKRSIVLSRCLNSLGFSNRIFARNCLIKQIEVNEARAFLDASHTQGYCASSIKLGLFNYDILVAVMTFGKSRFSKVADWELLRYASECNTTVVGGASKLFKHFLKQCNEPIVSYCDLRWGSGQMYESLGFNFSHVSDPSYFYFKGYNIKSRYEFQKHKLSGVLATFDPAKTEWENVRDNGYHKVYDCGTAVFIYIP